MVLGYLYAVEMTRLSLKDTVTNIWSFVDCIGYHNLHLGISICQSVVQWVQYHAVIYIARCYHNV